MTADGGVRAAAAEEAATDVRLGEAATHLVLLRLRRRSPCEGYLTVNNEEGCCAERRKAYAYTAYSRTV